MRPLKKRIVHIVIETDGITDIGKKPKDVSVIIDDYNESATGKVLVDEDGRKFHRKTYS